ncbi:hypothetical protein [Streptococcus himalayensis]|uniref:Uncharacterized protein n=1 Tax=Streptococcus himalayensis TaxID=1888195 RepID=A0A917A7X6_9STRE|nr:hypothetical protein [Streptococcus himalayensis]GGE32917.1 hypothetical protein GCM10011510_12830 [Streptococcus himalayensis]
MKQKTTLLHSLGLTLFSTTLLLNIEHVAFADDSMNVTDSYIDYNSDSSPQTLDSSIEAALQNGVILVETEE